jgi:hypothetical protein
MHVLFFLFFFSYLWTAPIDIVIPCHEKDRVKLRFAIAGAKRYVKNKRNIYVISKEPFTKDAIWIDEKKTPFSHLFFQTNAPYPIQRSGWTFQQLLKLYAFEIIPTLSENALILDADTVFINPVSFMNEEGKACYTLGGYPHQFYIDFAKKLIPQITSFSPNESPIAHHMLFQKTVIESLFKEIRQIHEMEPFEAFLKAYIGEVHPSEFELYFNYAFMQTEQVLLRPLLWKDTRSLSLKNLRKYKKKGFHFVSNHHWMK